MATTRRRSPSVYRQAFDRAPDALLLIDAAGRVVEVNQAGARLPILGPPRAGDAFVRLWPRPVRARLESWFEQLDEQGAAPLLEVAVPTPDGDVVLELSGCRLVGPEPPLREVLVRDITERVRLAERALHAERLASVGRLAATLAHEIRNTLAGVDGALQVFEAAGDLPASRREIVGEMRERIGRTREVVDDLLLYSRPPRLSRHRWPVSEVLAAMRDSVTGHPEVEDVAVVVEDRAAPGDLVEVDAFHIKLVSRNLILNAAQSMSGRGEVRLRAEPRGGEILFRFEDQGPGIPAGLELRVFEPFFTTRPGGTGLGLPIAANIVEAHGGRLYLDQGRSGGRFVVALPRYAVSDQEIEPQ